MVSRGTVRVICDKYFLGYKWTIPSHPHFIVYNILLSMRCKYRLLNLPPELAFYILSMLSPQDLYNVRQSSRSFAALADHPFLWHSILLKGMPSQTWRRTQIHRLIGRHIQSIENITIHNINDESLRYILNHCTNLKSLHVFGWKTLTHHALTGPSMLPKLEKLTLACRNVAALDAASVILLVERSPSLNELSILCPTAVRSQPLVASVSSTQLVRLQLYSSRRWPPEHLAITARNCARLSQFNLMYYKEDAMPQA
ncbi:hypothetical protein BGW37DRAFT_490169 [Umbelopsis sp. PMI_123]|nr:hypothetical protein BGW37DRAFT_490169 [Umbelopsis sp. PMI_123]